MLITDIIGKERLKQQVFVSSTYLDLKEARLEIIHGILKYDHIPVGMELFGAENDDIWRVIEKTIDKSDYYVVIIGDRYGSITGDINKEDTISYTEKEYDYALKQKITILPFIKEHRSKDTDETDMHRAKLDKFISKIKSKHVPDYWSKDTDLKALVIPSILQKIASNESKSGWLKINDVNMEKLFENFIEVADERPPLDQIKTAQNSIFISGIGMSFIKKPYNRRYLIDLGENVKITLATVKFPNDDIEKYMKNFFGKKEEGYLEKCYNNFIDFLEQLKSVRQNNVNAIFLNIYNPISYFSIDYLKETESSCIWAKHYTINENNGITDFFYTRATPQEKLYYRYLEQINSIIDYDGDLINRF